MARNKLFMVDGQVKNIELSQYPPEAWNWYSGKPNDKDDLLYALVPAVYRVADMSAQAIADMPFIIMNENDDEIDTSENWQNTLGFMENPRELLRLWRMSIFMYNRAYGFMEASKGKREMVYIRADTITPKLDPKTGKLTEFIRTIGAGSKRYPVDDGPIFYMFKRDYSTEVLPSEYSEFNALMTAAGVLRHSDSNLLRFFERGAIPPSMLFVKGVMAIDEDVKKLERVWDRVIRGFYDYLGKVFQGEGIEVHKLTDGLRDLTNDELYKTRVQDIALAAGMPLSLLLANSANYATASVEYMLWFRHSVIPMAKFMQESINLRLLKPLGYKLVFQPEITDAGTQEEEQRSGAFYTYVLAGIRQSIAAQIVGIDMPPNITVDQLDERFEQRQERYEETIENPRESNIEETNLPKTFSVEEMQELLNWHQIAIGKYKRGESLAFQFVPRELDPLVAAVIRDRLTRCKSEKEIALAFEEVNLDISNPETKEIVSALNRVALAMERGEK